MHGSHDKFLKMIWDSKICRQLFFNNSHRVNVKTGQVLFQLGMVSSLLFLKKNLILHLSPDIDARTHIMFDTSINFI